MTKCEFEEGECEDRRSFDTDTTFPDLDKVVEYLACEVGGCYDKEIKLYSKSGNRVGQVKTHLEGLGYENVVNGGGWDATSVELEGLCDGCKAGGIGCGFLGGAGAKYDLGWVGAISICYRKFYFLS